MKVGLAALVGVSSAALPNIPDILNLKGLELFPVEEKPFIDSERLQDLIKPEALKKWASKLWDAADKSTDSIGHPTRALGTAGHNATLELIFDALDDLSDYYNFEAQPFVAMGSITHNWSLANSDSQIASKPFKMSPSANLTSVPVKLVPHFGCLPSDFEGTADQIAVVKRGQCPSGEKAEIAGLAGAKGVLIWDPEAKNTSEPLSGGDLGVPLGHQVATLGISADSALKFKNGDRLNLNVDSEIIEVDTVNIIAETKDGDHDNVVFAGAHSDSVMAGPGINDNGSGLITLLEVAKQLTNFRVKNAVRFAWWSAEELGLKGSLYYTENLTKKQASKIRLFLDYDMLASPNYIYEIYDSDDSRDPLGSSALRDMYKDWYVSHGYNYTLQPFDGRSDYVGFVEIGIPSSGIDAGVEEIKTHEQYLQFGGKEGIAFDPCYHQACDDLDNINIDPWLVNSKAVAHSVAGYATTLEGFPERSNAFYEQREPKPRKWAHNALI